MSRTRVRHRNLLGTTIANGRLEFIAVLGIGAYGVVYLARDTAHYLHRHRVGCGASAHPAAYAMATYGSASSGYYAVKCLNKHGLDARQRVFQRRETLLHTMTSGHPNVVTLHRVFDSPNDPYAFIVLEYCADGDLFAMITEVQKYTVPTEPYVADPAWADGRPLPESKEYVAERLSMDSVIKNVFDQILSAIEHCHSLGIYHRDIKPENILCGEHGMHMYLADFGLATGERYSSDFGCGSSFYMSPECQGGIYRRIERYSTAANDVWSLGVILVNLICGRNPWREATLADETFREFLANPNFLLEILPISNAVNDILKRVFCTDEAKRCTLGQLRAWMRAVPSLTASNFELWRRQQANLAQLSLPNVPQVPSLQVQKANIQSPITIPGASTPTSDSPGSTPPAGTSEQDSHSSQSTGTYPLTPTSADAQMRTMEKAKEQQLVRLIDGTVLGT